MIEEKKDNNLDLEEKRFCRLCGKNKKTKEFKIIQLAKLGNMIVKYNGCQACEIVIHNATVIINETVQNFLKQKDFVIPPKKKIVDPQGRPM